MITKVYRASYISMATSLLLIIVLAFPLITVITTSNVKNDMLGMLLASALCVLIILATISYYMRLKIFINGNQLTKRTLFWKSTIKIRHDTKIEVITRDPGYNDGVAMSLIKKQLSDEQKKYFKIIIRNEHEKMTIQTPIVNINELAFIIREIRQGQMP
jgi:hypothetical protein